jgi:hypothetical protein
MSENVITLTNENSLQILIQYVELAQQKGSYLLQEAELLKRAVDVVNGQKDHQIDFNASKNLLIQGVVKGQQKGAYNLSDAALLFQAVKLLDSQSESTQQTPQQTPQQPPQQPDKLVEVDDVEDLSDLSDPIPFKPKEI